MSPRSGRQNNANRQDQFVIEDEPYRGNALDIRSASLPLIMDSRQQLSDDDWYDWDLLWQVERDICFLYHEQGQYLGLVGDLSYGSVYAHRYWDVLARMEATHFNDPREQEFIRDGCMVMIMSMALDFIKCGGTYIVDKVDACRRGLKATKPTKPDSEQLRVIALRAIDAMYDEPERRHRFDDESVWINETFIRTYFKEMSLPPYSS